MTVMTVYASINYVMSMMGLTTVMSISDRDVSDVHGGFDGSDVRVFTMSWILRYRPMMTII